MPNPQKVVWFIPGATDILLIAPHAAVVIKKDGRRLYKNDERTGLIARAIEKQLECSALINTRINRSELDYNVREDAEKDPIFINNMRSVLDAKGPTLVVWIHGIGKKGLGDEKKAMNFNGRLDCLIGFGQPDRHTIPENVVDSFIDLLKKQKIAARKTRSDSDDYRGWAIDNMNQWFRHQKEYKDLSKVQSVQLEFSPYRRRQENVQATATAVANALSALVR